MAQVTFKGTSVALAGSLPAVGEKAPDFQLCSADLSTKTLADYEGKRKVLSIVPSLDTPVCATSARRFNEEIGQQANTVALNISADLPFAAARFCSTEGLERVQALSTFRSPGFGQDYGVAILDGPLAGLLSRAVLVLDEDNRVIYSEQVPDIASEPNYEAALAGLASV